MIKKIAVGLPLATLLIGALALVSGIHLVKASGTIYIRADGSVDPPTILIQRIGDVYTLTANITSNADAIVVERDNVVFDGSGFTIEGTGASFSNGISLKERSNVTIENTIIMTFYNGINFSYASNNRLSGNTIANSTADGIYLFSSSNNSINGNVITNNSVSGIHVLLSSNNIISENTVNASALTNTYKNVGVALEFSSNNRIIGNTVTHTSEGIWIASGIAGSSRNNIIARNNITDNGDGVWLRDASNNTFYLNDFFNNIVPVDNHTPEDANFWDSGGEGNYWSDYLVRYPDASQIDSTRIMDTPYIIDANNQDNYPLMNRYYIPEFLEISVVALFMTATLLALMLNKKSRIHITQS